ncbi:lipopolysaccharide assembly protein LapB [Undibacterium sp. CY21W]|uniref:tetratricopeptide repeat protein n=1 Tax=Undibacterium sp. CY21W TaxID=2762293 RepID=UPI00164A202C|nr:hypothetical protein [Undibacterium sp. CY21W]MBC3928601.1 hypothetical protein [Undibacterium sp. CY21W]
MNILKKLFGGNKVLKSRASNISEPPTTTPADDPNLIRVYDAYDREMFITRQQWHDNVLLGAIEKHWDDADKLAGFIMQSLHDKFFEEMIKPAERLLELERDAERSVVLLAIVYLKIGRLDDSERVLQQYISRNGESGIVFTNLAKVYAERGDEEKALATLWHALELDPNQDNGLGWYEVIHREKGGETAGIDALRRIASIPSSWRAQLWLARGELRSQHLGAAQTLYRECLARAGKPAPTDMLVMISGDLGNAGHLSQIFELVEPAFEPAVHGIEVGNNLIKAHVTVGQLEDARKILDQLYILKRPDWKDALGFWDTEIARTKVAKVNANNVKEEKIEIGLMVDAGPVWLNYDSPAGSLFPAKAVDSPVVSFLGSTAEVARAPDHVEQQLADPPGRMSRALPLFLAEQIEFRSHARSQTLIPWVTVPNGGFVLGGEAWEDAAAVTMTQNCEQKADYLVVTHLNTTTDEWVVDLRLLCTKDGQCIGRVFESFSLADPSRAVRCLADKLLELLNTKAGIEIHAATNKYILTESNYFPAYLLRLEQLLAVRCSSIDKVDSRFLNGEREILEGNLLQCLDAPTSVNTRLLFAQTLRAMKRARPDILPEFSERVALLQKEHPLAAPVQRVVQEIFDEALAL